MRDFSNSLPMLLLKARETTMGFFRPILNQHGLSEQQWRVLRVLFENPNISAQSLAQMSLLLSPSLTRMLSLLEEKRLIARQQAVNDLREQSIRLTEKGEKLFETVGVVIEQEYNELRSRMKPERLDMLYELLKELIEMNNEEHQKRKT